MTLFPKCLAFATALVAAVTLPAATGRAQTISNTASAEWTASGRTSQALSNRVDVTVTPRPPELPTIRT
ncbi:MAG: hypothetical protein ACT6Q3_16635 [Sphingopyxis sp.]